MFWDRHTGLTVYFGSLSDIMKKVIVFTRNFSYYTFDVICVYRFRTPVSCILEIFLLETFIWSISILLSFTILFIASILGRKCSTMNHMWWSCKKFDHLRTLYSKQSILPWDLVFVQQLAVEARLWQVPLFIHKPFAKIYWTEAAIDSSTICTVVRCRFFKVILFSHFHRLEPQRIARARFVIY